MRLFACIRHPAGTIRSWKRSFPHLANADVGNVCAREAEQIRRLTEIRSAIDLRIRRALLWRHLALTILEFQELLTVVKYEGIVQSMSSELSRVVAGLEDGRRPDRLPLVCDVRICDGKTEPLDAEERQIIADLCGPVAGRFGYQL